MEINHDWLESEFACPEGIIYFDEIEPHEIKAVLSKCIEDNEVNHAIWILAKALHRDDLVKIGYLAAKSVVYLYELNYDGESPRYAIDSVYSEGFIEEDYLSAYKLARLCAKDSVENLYSSHAAYSASYAALSMTNDPSAKEAPINAMLRAGYALFAESISKGNTKEKSSLEIINLMKRLIVKAIELIEERENNN